MNEYVINILHEQIQQIKQSFNNIKQKDQLLSNNQFVDTKELQDQVNFKLLINFFSFL